MKKFIKPSLVALSLIFCSNLQATNLSLPEGKVLLTVTGAISNTNNENGSAEFDLQMLMDLGMVSLETSTPWSEGKDLYRGPLLKTLIDVLEVKGSVLSVKALNDYSASVPIKDAYQHDVILAVEMNGEAMSIRNKGPIFILYPFDLDPNLNNEIIYNRSVWQIKTINVE